MTLVFLILTLIINILLLINACKQKNKLNIGTYYLYFQLGLTAINCINIFQAIFTLTPFIKIEEILECFAYSIKLILFFLVYLISISLYDANFKFYKHIPLCVPTILGSAIFLTSPITQYIYKDFSIIYNDQKLGILFYPIVLYHMFLAIVGYVISLIKTYKAKKKSFAFSLGLVGILLLCYYYSGISNLPIYYECLPLTIISIAFGINVKDYKLETLSGKSIISNAFSKNYAIAYCNKNDKIIEYNENFKSILSDYNLKNTDNFETTFKALSIENKDIIKDMLKTAKTKKQYSSTILTYKLEDKIKYLKLNVYPVIVEERNIGNLMLLKDLTIAQTEKINFLERTNSIIADSKINTMNEMIGCIIHDINTPLSTIKTGSSLLADKYKDDEFKKELFDQIILEADNISKISNNVKEQIKNINEDKNKSFSINDLIKTIAPSYQEKMYEKNIKCLFKENAQVTMFDSYSKLFQALVNIILTSIGSYATPTHYGDNENKNLIVITLDEDKENILINIEDFATVQNSIKLENLFQDNIPSDSSNIGLYIAYSIITTHFKGTLKITSSKDIGNYYNITIPKGGNKI